MTLLETIKNDMKDAMRNKDMATLDTVRLILASAKNKAIELGKELDDADVIAVLKSDLKKMKDALETFTANAREDLAEKAQAEIKVLEKYLPAQLTDGELEDRVRAKLKELGITDAGSIGKAMGAVMADLKELADGSRIKAAVDKILKG